jgi:serine/threonine-protein kinase PknG
VCEIQFDGFVYPAFDQIVSQLAKMRARALGKISLPVVVRIPVGGGIGAVEHHSESNEAYFAHTAGLKVVACSNPVDAYFMVQQAILSDDPWEWRAIWLAGLAALARDDAAAAQAAFNAVYGQVPGELAPKLALALACENGGQPDVAELLYLTCLRTDANYTAPAAFGLARIRAARHGGGQGDLSEAIAALDMVPSTSRSFVAARRQRATLLIDSGGGLDTLSAALDSVASITLDPRDRAGLRVQVLSAALDDVTNSGPRPSVHVGGVPAEPPALRDGLERAYRDLATLTEQRDEKIRLVDEANKVRRWTWR